MDQEDRFLKIGSIVTFLIMILINTLSSLKSMNLKTVAEVAASYPNLLTPADFTFSIWGLIYTLLFLFSIYQLEIIKNRHLRYKKELLHQLRIVFIATNLMNAGWIIAWVFEYMAFSVMLSFGMFIVLYVYGGLLKREYLTIWERLLIKLPFSLYFGWMTLATAINIVILLISTGFSLFGISEEMWLIIIILLITFYVLFRTMKNRDIFFCISVLWGYGGCLVQHVSYSGWNGAYPAGIAMFIAGIVVLSGCIGYLLLFRKISL